MKYSNIYVFFGLVVLTYFVFGLHKKSKNTNFKITSLLRQEKYTNIQWNPDVNVSTLPTKTAWELLHLYLHLPYPKV